MSCEQPCSSCHPDWLAVSGRQARPLKELGPHAYLSTGAPARRGTVRKCVGCLIRALEGFTPRDLAQYSPPSAEDIHRREQLREIARTVPLPLDWSNALE